MAVGQDFASSRGAALGAAAVKKASEYRGHAAECRRLADSMIGLQRDQLLEMAATWEQLARERSDLVRRHPELAVDGELEEET